MNNKARGNAVEREFARKISKWLTGSEDELVCWRVQDSGSVATNAIKRGQKYKESGDLRAIDSRFAPFFDKYHIDTKAIKDVNLFITPDNLKSNQLYQEWIKTVSDAEKNGKIPMMPVKWTGKRYQFVVYPIFTQSKIKCDFHMAFHDFQNDHNFAIQELNNFFALNNYKELL